MQTQDEITFYKRDVEISQISNLADLPKPIQAEIQSCWILDARPQEIIGYRVDPIGKISRDVFFSARVFWEGDNCEIQSYASTHLIWDGTTMQISHLCPACRRERMRKIGSTSTLASYICPKCGQERLWDEQLWLGV
jgi:predicted RNA-binding Zn-ribbon protein involved in translation (DUF1610 family)